jgi:hypothetical protein
MPQLDLLTFYSQAFVTSVILALFFVYAVSSLLPLLHRSQKMRNALVSADAKHFSLVTNLALLMHCEDLLFNTQSNEFVNFALDFQHNFFKDISLAPMTEIISTMELINEDFLEAHFDNFVYTQLFIGDDVEDVLLVDLAEELLLDTSVSDK